MRAYVVSVMVFAVCFLLSAPTHVALAGPTGGVIIAPMTTADVTIDGNLNEWKLPLFTDEEKIVLTRKSGFINKGKIDGDDDFSAVIYAMYDESNLYLAADVTDDASENGFAGGNNWQNDCIEIWIDGAGDMGTMTDHGGNDPDNYQLNVDINGSPFIYRNDDAAKLLPQIETASEVKGTNYRLEVRIPFEAIPELDLNASRIMGLGISFVDSDKGVWNHILWQGEVENDPTQWGKLEFSQDKLAVSAAGKLAVSWARIRK